jgi:hypothetical protein
VIGRFISPDSIVQAPGDPQTLNRYSYCRNNPLLYTDPTGHIFGIDDAIIFGVLIGAALGASVSAITGGDIAMGALTGAISGGFFGGAGVACRGLQAVTQAGIHALAGAASGAINAGITGGDVLQGAGISAVSAGVAKYAMAGILPKFSMYPDAGEWGQAAMEGATAVATGTVMGGISAVMMGGDFGDGAVEGAWTSAYGFMFNSASQKLIRLSKALWGKVMSGSEFKRPRVKVYGDENGTQYLKTKIFPDGTVESKNNLNVSKGAIERAVDALKVGGIMGAAEFMGEIVDPFDASATAMPADDMIQTGMDYPNPWN